MPSRTSARALREEGLERTENEMEFTSWPQISMINQKNYYTDFMKRDDQILALRLQAEESRDRMAKAARDKDRALAGAEPDADADETMLGADDAQDEQNAEMNGSKVIVIHPGSQNLRIGFASDVIPKSVPMVVARRIRQSPRANVDHEPLPKRMKVDSENPTPESLFGSNFAAQMSSLGQDVKNRMRRKGRRIVPNSREQAIAFNRKSPASVITEHNDTHRVDWTEVTLDGADEPADYFTGHQALRIPDDVTPAYELCWPLRYGHFNEEDYSSEDQLLRDFVLIIEEAIRDQLGLTQKKDWAQYSCVFVIPDLYERNYMTTSLDILIRELGLARVSFIQESVAASFGAGYPTCVIVDLGARKTSICCVDEGMCIESSRIVLRYGGDDVTELFSRMMLFDRFPYAELDLTRRSDFLLAEELKHRVCNMDVESLALQQFEFHVRNHGHNTRHYMFKTYDEVILAPMGYFMPELFENENKLLGRRCLIDRSYDIYDGTPNDPMSSAQAQILDAAAPSDGLNPVTDLAADGARTGTPVKPNVTSSNALASDTPARDEAEDTPQPARNGSPGAGDADTGVGGGGPNNSSLRHHPLADMIRSADLRDRSLPLLPLHRAVMLSIEAGAKGDDRKMRDLYGGIIPVGGGAQVAGFNAFLEDELKETRMLVKDIMVAPPPREIDAQVLSWKGASVFGKLKTNDSWINRLEYDRLGNRILAYKALWNY